MASDQYFEFDSFITQTICTANDAITTKRMARSLHTSGIIQHNTRERSLLWIVRFHIRQCLSLNPRDRYTVWGIFNTTLANIHIVGFLDFPAGKGSTTNGETITLVQENQNSDTEQCVCVRFLGWVTDTICATNGATVIPIRGLFKQRWQKFICLDRSGLAPKKPV